MANTWVVRAGKYGERIDWCLEFGFAGGGWTEVPDLTSFKENREGLKSIVEQVYGGPKGRIATYTGQLWMLINRISVGDTIVLPIKATSQLAIGQVLSEYSYKQNEEDPSKRHRLGVRWIRKDIPKTLAKQDLLYQLNSALTVFNVGNDDAPFRIEQLLNGKPDPGARTLASQGASAAKDDSIDSAVEPLDIEELALDGIAKIIQQDFKGHELSELIEAILTAEGYVCRNSPPGADGGVDILAGTGPLGMDSPKIVVQVKSQTGAVSDEVVQKLHGALDRFRADQALLVTFGGVTGPAKAFLDTQYFKVRVWTLEDILNGIFRHYALLPGEIKSRLPLKQIWVPISVGE